MKRKLVWIVFIGLAASAGIYSWFFLTPDKNINSFYLIPKDAIYIMETSTPVESWNRFSKSEVWRFLKKQEYFAGIGRKRGREPPPDP